MSEWTNLATFNSERARGLVHTQEWRQLMAVEQERFDKARVDDLIVRGFRPIGNGDVWVGPSSTRLPWWRRWRA